MKPGKLLLILGLWLCGAAFAHAQEPLGLIPPEPVAPAPMSGAGAGLIDMPGLTPGDNADSDLPPDREYRDGFVTLEFLLWWIQDAKVPTLVSGGDVLDLVPAAIGQPGTFPLLGDVINLPVAAGGRLTMFQWLGDDQVLGLEGSVIAVHVQSRDVFTHNSTGEESVIARPFFNANTQQFDADPVGLPFAQTGQLEIVMPSTLYSGEINAHLATGGGSDFIYRYFVGPRYLQFEEKLKIKQYSVETTDGQINYIHDQFDTVNRFYGGQMGVGFDYRGGNIMFALRAKLGFGMNQQIAEANGATALTQPDGSVTVLGDRGLLVQPFNANNRFYREAFSVVPEVTVNTGLQLNEYISLYLGYNFLYWSNVIRPGDTIDSNVSVQPCCPNVTIGERAPLFVPGQSAGVWLQGLTFGLEINF